MSNVRIHEINATMRVVDGESLLSPQLMQRIVRAVMEALEAGRDDDRSRRRDTRIGGSCCGAHDAEGADE